MFGLVSRPRRTSPSPRRRLLFLEQLEARDCPSSLTLNLIPGTMKNVTLSGDLAGAANNAGQTIQFNGQVSGKTTTDANGHYSITLQATGLGQITATDADGSSNSATVMLASPPPTIQNFTVSDSYGVWTFSGQVLAPPSSTISLVLNDGGTFKNTQVTVGAGGNFSYSVQLNSVDNTLVNCTATDQWGQSFTVVTIVSDAA